MTNLELGPIDKNENLKLFFGVGFCICVFAFACVMCAMCV